jgi:3-hydroxyisobutyrate dehydrogenase
MTHGASTVGFIGLGIMGEPIARNLRRAGVPLTVWNRSLPAVESLVVDGAHAAASVDEVFARCRIVFVMLAHADALDAVLGRHGARRTDLFAGKVLVNMGTVAPEYSQLLAADVAGAGGHYVEAPVSGSRVPAEQAALVGMMAGDPDVVDEVRPLLEHVCASVTVCGAVPAALTMKLAVNVFLIATVTGLAESFHFAERRGLDLDVLRSLLDAGQMSSAISRVKTGKLADGDLSPQASIRDVLANNVLITEAARAAGIATPLLDACELLYAEAVAAGDGGVDMVGVVRAIARTDPSHPPVSLSHPPGSLAHPTGSPLSQT